MALTLAAEIGVVVVGIIGELVVEIAALDDELVVLVELVQVGGLLVAGDTDDVAGLLFFDLLES